MATLKPIPPYRLAGIYQTCVRDMPGTYETYKLAYKDAIIRMEGNERTIAMLIYSQNTAIVLKRKWIKK